MTDRRRVQTRDPNRGRGRLQVHATPVARPLAVQDTASETKRRADQLVTSLATISPKLNAHLQEEQRSYAAAQALQAEGRLHGLTFEEATDLVRSGELRETESPWFDAAFRKQYGLLLASQTKGQIEAEYESFDFENDSIDSLLKPKLAGAIEVFAGDTLVEAGYAEGIRGYATRFRQQHAENEDTFRRNKSLDRAYSLMAEGFTERLLSGASPEDLSAFVRDQYHQNQTLGIKPKEMDGFLLELGSVAASEGRPDVIEALFEEDRTSLEGDKIPAVINKRGLTNQVLRLKTSAEAVRDQQRRIAQAEMKAAQAAELAAFEREERELLVSLEVAAAEGTLTGTQRNLLQQLELAGVYTSEEAKDLLIRNDRAALDLQAEEEFRLSELALSKADAEFLLNGDSGLIQDTRLVSGDRSKTLSAERREQNAIAALRAQYTDDPVGYLQAVSLSGVVDEGIARNMRVSWRTAAEVILGDQEEGGRELEALQSALDHFRIIKETQPAMVDKYLPDHSGQVFYRLANYEYERTGDAQTALRTAVRAVSERTFNPAIVSQVSRQQMRDAVELVAAGGWFDGTGENAGAIESSIRAVVPKYSAVGAERAIELAAEEVLENRFNLEGNSYLRPTGPMPTDVEGLLTTLRSIYADEIGDRYPLFDQEDFVIVPTPTNRNVWVFMPQIDGIPAAVPPLATFSNRELGNPDLRRELYRKGRLADGQREERRRAVELAALNSEIKETEALLEQASDSETRRENGLLSPSVYKSNLEALRDQLEALEGG